MSIEAIILIAIGFILLFIELFVLPSFGPIGIFGIILMVAGITLAGYREGIRMAVIYAGVTIGISLPLCAVGFWLMPRTRIGKSLILNTSEQSQAGFRSSSDLEKFVGKTGVVLTPLRPAGTIEVDNNVRLDVLTEGEFIEKGEEVEVVKVEGSRVVVRRI